MHEGVKIKLITFSPVIYYIIIRIRFFLGVFFYNSYSVFSRIKREVSEFNRERTGHAIKGASEQENFKTERTGEQETTNSDEESAGDRRR